MSDSATRIRRKRSTRKQRVVLLTLGCVTLVLALIMLSAHVLSGNDNLKWLSLGYMVVGAVIILFRALFVVVDARSKRRYSKR